MDDDALLDAILPHVAFDGWTRTSLEAAGADLGLTPEELHARAPRGAVGLAADYHRRGDARMVEKLAAQSLEGYRFREQVALAVRLRLEGEDREVVRRGMALFALPQHAAEGSRLIWGTADAIWTALGDTSDDVNWYSKRMILSGVFSSTVLYWLGDMSEGSVDTWGFLDRRIEGVMQFEKMKATLRKAPVLGQLVSSPLNPLNRVRAPRSAASGAPQGGWPGRWAR